MRFIIRGFLILVLTVLVACVPLKERIYFQGNIAKPLEELSDKYSPVNEEYRVRPHDNLYIKILSFDEATTAFLNNEAGYTTMATNALSASLIGYKVDGKGNIDFPFVGELHVAGLSTSEIKNNIQQAIGKYVAQSNVIVKLLNDIVTVVGEVRTPGTYGIFNEEVSVIEAIAMAGDITDFGNRKNVRLIRKKLDTPQVIQLNLTDDTIMFSPYFYLQPGDVIYVEPLPAKKWGMTEIPVELILSSITTLVLVLSFIQQ